MPNLTLIGPILGISIQIDIKIANLIIFVRPTAVTPSADIPEIYLVYVQL